MKAPKFISEDHELQHVFDNANGLIVGSKFEYVGFSYTVTGFTKTSVLATCGNGKDERFDALDFENYITAGFLTIK